ncbi:MAG: double-strand break repair protein AddB [Alphaproteobacteria bacterium]|nr:double-strand break repair protein AddB [Alphaproteobacteria bacterium]
MTASPRLKDKPSLFYIPAGLSFADSLAQTLLQETKSDPLALARYMLWLPTRRACRTVREAFLRQSNGVPLLLPRLSPIGDIDEDTLSWQSLMPAMSSNLPDLEIQIQPALSPLKRQMLLTRLIGAFPQYSQGTDRDFALAEALGRLMDQVYTEDLALSDLPSVVQAAEFADHWQITLRFLEILSVHWPQILADEGVIDSADRRNRLIKAYTRYLEATPPETPVIAAGSTGSIPATRGLLSVIARLPQGRLILPGLDPDISEIDWQSLNDTHPQGTLKALLDGMKVSRTDVQIWGAAQNITADHISRLALAREIMRPAETTDQWSSGQWSPRDAETLRTGARHIECYHAKTLQEEADIISMIFRETLETPAQTAALVTPDRSLSARVISACQRWGINLDDSGGIPLTQTPAGIFISLVVRVLETDFAPASLMALLKHELCCYSQRLPDVILALDHHFCRGVRHTGGIDNLRDRIKEGRHPLTSEMLNLINQIINDAKDFKVAVSSCLPMSAWVMSHIQLAERWGQPERLWSGEDGESLSSLLSDLLSEPDILPPLDIRTYQGILESLLHKTSVRASYGQHPRLKILGQLEARLFQADIMILGGLNEGTWPPAPPVDPFMSRPMRQQFGLPSPERSVGLSAHDFVQGLCTPRVILTRSLRVEGTPTVPARWLSRFDAVCRALKIEGLGGRQGVYQTYARLKDIPERVIPVGRPAPCPPPGNRPRTLPVTAIETWLKNPYGVYARYVLGVKQIQPMEKMIDPAFKGSILHKGIEKWVQQRPKTIHGQAVPLFLSLIEEELKPYRLPAGFFPFWRPRLIQIAEWLEAQSQTWEDSWCPFIQETRGELTLIADKTCLTLTTRADRIDISVDGTTYAIIDYKSSLRGLSLARMKQVTLPQLPLEALILSEGGFKEVPARPVSHLAYWIITGGRTPGEVMAMDDIQNISPLIARARDMITGLMTAFADPQTPYLCRPRPGFLPDFDDYELLARVKEWSSQEEPDGDAA